MYKFIRQKLGAAFERSTNEDQYLIGYDSYVPYLIELDRIFEQLKDHPMYSDNLERIVEHTRQAIKLTIELYQSHRGMKDRQTLRAFIYLLY